MLAAPDVDRMRTSVLRDLDCADVVATTRRLLTRATPDDSTLIAAQLEACLIACRRSEEQCRLTAPEHEHCRLCTTQRTRAPRLAAGHWKHCAAEDSCLLSWGEARHCPDAWTPGRLGADGSAAAAIA